MALKAMRFPINMAHLYSDPEKRAALAAAAQAMTPGAAAAATQAALASTWAYAEADNDVELLWQGKKVPMVKDYSTWAIELDNAIEGRHSGEPSSQQSRRDTITVSICRSCCFSRMKTSSLPGYLI